jgi:sterol 3beta-glucosyltransferase
VFSVLSRGDVQPFVAIAALLLKRGSKVAIATHEEFRPLVMQVPECEFVSLDSSPTSILRDFAEPFADGSIASDIAFSVRVAEEGKDNRRKMWEGAVVFKPTLVVSMMSCHLECISIATRLGVPSVVCTTYPLYPSSERIPMSMLSNERQFPLVLNHFFSFIGFKIAWSLLKNELNDWRLSIGLDPLTEFSWDASPTINMYSPVLAPPSRDWPPYVYDCGFCFVEDALDVTIEPDASLAEFLATGSKPIYFGFGSMPVASANEQVKLFCKVCVQLGQRGVMLHPNAKDVDPSLLGGVIFVVKSVPHWWLFPRCCAAVFHGGAGTTAAALKAGIPCELEKLDVV